MAELINKQDSLNKGRVKINESILASERAEQNSTEALNTANEAKELSEDTQTQLDTIVINGDSSVEAAQARVDENGYAYLKLKARLDTEHSQVTSSIENTNIDLKERGINIKTLGAIGDGVADDTQIIQYALNLAKSSNVHIFIPSGTYKITSVLNVYSNTHITLDSDATILRAHDGSFFLNGEYGGNYTGYEGNGNITFEGGTLDGNIINFPSNFSGISLGHGKNITARNMVFKDMIFGHWFDVSGCSDVLIENCQFLGYKDSGGREYSEAIQISSHSEGGFPAFGSYDSTPSRNVTIKDCYFGSSGTEGTTAWAVGVGDHGQVDGVYNSNIKIIGNTFENLTYAGVRIFKYRDTIIQNNSFLNCQRGVIISNPSTIVETSKNIIIDNNIFRNTIGRDIEAGAWFVGGVVSKMESIVIRGNIFDNDIPSLTDSIFIRLADNVSIESNIFKNVYRAAYLLYVSNMNFVKNKITDVVRETVFTDEPDVGFRNMGLTSNFIIEGNIINGTGRHGLYVAYVKGFSINNNVINSPAIETDNTRSGVLLTSSSSDGFIAHNKVRMNVSGNQNQYGVQSTATTSNIQLFNNDLEGKTGKQNLRGANVFDGFYITDSVGVRRIVTVNTSGTLVVN
ncbi:right-handed parallel beta-helix repeat-containing protein [Ornithinibacillus bavariensis]|uniref:Pectate lyase superfamily protein domain-containing protein n=1 Tax=Ornithinibacillus bavariensis TaxID=545502 RepID=A0A920C6B5_9BACI|nr:right-handed parallel beta-helix repeat-containing protein [Ornithinibacillus bavariensis]GIO27731.1 hypothetical protein J43TS3_23420 [Ornithinibacillus bavariensis]